jgi:hypothetical protein
MQLLQSPRRLLHTRTKGGRPRRGKSAPSRRRPGEHPPAQHPTDLNSPNQIAWLIREWTFEDAAIDGEYRETGTRTCGYALGNDYIVCESVGTGHRGRQR